MGQDHESMDVPQYRLAATGRLTDLSFRPGFSAQVEALHPAAPRSTTRRRWNSSPWRADEANLHQPRDSGRRSTTGRRSLTTPRPINAPVRVRKPMEAAFSRWTSEVTTVTSD